MRTKSALLLVVALLCGAFSMTGCGQPADAAAKEFIAVIDKHQKKVEDGTWDKAAFDADMKPAIDKLKAIKKDHPDLPVTKSIDDELTAAKKRFDASCDSKGNTEAELALNMAILEMVGQ